MSISVSDMLKIVGVNNIKELKSCIAKSGELYTNPGSFCSNCSNLVIHDRYCTECGKENKNYRY